MYPEGAPRSSRETRFNDSNPFYRAPMAYGLAVLLLAVSLGFQEFERRSFLARFGQGCYAIGNGLPGLRESASRPVGFTLRVLISGYGPVTNMYETVICRCSVISATLGLILELIYRKGYAALAGSGVALLGTWLAANVPLLDPHIGSLQPVLRSNYWLGIHVLTEVSSYGAFLLAAGLGLIGTFYYLLATYRRSPRFVDLTLPALPGLPLLAAGAAGLLASTGYFGPSHSVGNGMMLVSTALACIGGALTISVPVALVSEVVNRMSFRDEADLDDAAIAGSAHAQAPAATSVQTVMVGESQGTATVATLSKPSVSEIRAMAAANRPEAGCPPASAMQEHGRPRSSRSLTLSIGACRSAFS